MPDRSDGPVNRRNPLRGLRFHSFSAVLDMNSIPPSECTIQRGLNSKDRNCMVLTWVEGYDWHAQKSSQRFNSSALVHTPSSCWRCSLYPLGSRATPFRFRSNCIGGTRDLEPVLHRTHAGLATSSDGSTAGALLLIRSPSQPGIMIWSDACHELTFGPKTGEVQNFGFHALWIGRFNLDRVYMVTKTMKSSRSANGISKCPNTRVFASWRLIGSMPSWF